MASATLKALVARIARTSVGERLIALLTEPPVGGVDWKELRRTAPVSRWFGHERGQPLDRVYIEHFLQQNAGRIRGRVLEIAENKYTRRFGGQHVEHCDVLHAVPGNPAATIVADLTDAVTVPDGAYDCIVLTQTLQMIYDLRSSVRTLARILKPGGAVLATLPGISQISRSDMEQWGDFWRFTTASAKRLFAEDFEDCRINLTVYGNVLVSSAFLYGLAREDLTDAEINVHDPDYQFLIGVCAVKSAEFASQ